MHFLAICIVAISAQTLNKYIDAIYFMHNKKYRQELESQ